MTEIREQIFLTSVLWPLFSDLWDPFFSDRAGFCPRAVAVGAIKPIELLGPVSFTHCCASTPGLSTWWSSTALKGEPVSREASRLDAFSGYPVRT